MKLEVGWPQEKRGIGIDVIVADGRADDGCRKWGELRHVASTRRPYSTLPTLSHNLFSSSLRLFVSSSREATSSAPSLSPSPFPSPSPPDAPAWLCHLRPHRQRWIRPLRRHCYRLPHLCSSLARPAGRGRCPTTAVSAATRYSQRTLPRPSWASTT